MGIFSNKKPEYQEGDIVAHEEDTFRVRRNYGETLELVNHTGYHLTPTEQVEETYYCGLCRSMQPLSHFPH